MEKYKKIIKYISYLVNECNLSSANNTIGEDTSFLEKTFDSNEYNKFLLNDGSIKYIFKNTNGLSLTFFVENNTHLYNVVLSCGKINFSPIFLTRCCEISKNIDKFEFVSSFLDNEIKKSYYKFFNGNGDYYRCQLSLDEWLSFKINSLDGDIVTEMKYANQKNNISKKIDFDDAVKIIMNTYSFTGILNKFVNEVYKFDINQEINEYSISKKGGFLPVISEYELLQAISENSSEPLFILANACIKNIVKRYDINSSIPSLKEYFLSNNQVALAKALLFKIQNIRFLLEKFSNKSILDSFEYILCNFDSNIDISLPMIYIHQKNPEKYAKLCFLRDFEETFGSVDNYKKILVSKDDKVVKSPIYQFLFFSKERLTFKEQYMKLYNYLVTSRNIFEKYFDIYSRDDTSPYPVIDRAINVLSTMNQILESDNFNNVDIYMYLKYCFDRFTFIKNLEQDSDNMSFKWFNGNPAQKKKSETECKQLLAMLCDELKKAIPIDELCDFSNYVSFLHKIINSNSIFPTQIMCYDPLNELNSQNAMQINSIIKCGMPWFNFDVNIDLEFNQENEKINYDIELINSFFYGYKYKSKNKSYDVFQNYLEATYNIESDEEIIPIIEKTFFEKEIIKEYKENFKQFSKEEVKKKTELEDTTLSMQSVSVFPVIINDEKDIAN